METQNDLYELRSEMIGTSIVGLETLISTNRAIPGVLRAIRADRVAAFQHERDRDGIVIAPIARRTLEELIHNYATVHAGNTREIQIILDLHLNLLH